MATSIFHTPQARKKKASCRCLSEAVHDLHRAHDQYQNADDHHHGRSGDGGRQD